MVLFFPLEGKVLLSQEGKGQEARGREQGANGEGQGARRQEDWEKRLLCAKALPPSRPSSTVPPCL